MPGTPTPNHSIPTMAGGTDTVNTIDDTYNAGVTIIDGKLTKLFEQAISFAIAGEILVPVGNSDVIPQVFVPIRSGQTAKLTRCRYSIGAGTSATFKIQRNGADATGFIGMIATTTAAETNPTDITLSDNDRLQIIVTAVSGTPANMSVALILEHTV